MPTTQPLPTPVSEHWDWQLQAACRREHPEMFFHPQGERQAHRTHRINQAKAICAQCPVIARCRQHALEAIEPYGIWGGLSEDERAAILGVHSLATAARLISTSAGPASGDR